MFRLNLCKLITFATAAVMLVGCGKKQTGSVNYEQPLNAMKSSLNYADEVSYLSCWLPQEKARFTADEDFSYDFITEIFDSSDYAGRLQYKVENVSELSDSELNELKSEAFSLYGVRLDFTKAYKLNVRFSVQDYSGVVSELREITVVRLENIWYLYGDLSESVF